MTESDKGLTHLDGQGHARMVDVSGKASTLREAVAGAHITIAPEVVAMIMAGETPKGDVLATARIAGIMGAKRTADLIPLCHPLPLSSLKVELRPSGQGIEIVCLARTTGPTGVEMEALTGASIAALTLYDMCKALDRDMVIGEIRLLKKTGGRSGSYVRGEPD